MKKLLVICIIITGIIFISGCIGGEKASDSKTTTGSQINQQSNAETSNLILKLSDLPEGFEIYGGNSVIYGAKKTDYCTINTIYSSNCSIREYPYNQNIPPEYKTVGGRLSYGHKSWGRSYEVVYFIYDTADGIKGYILQLKPKYEKRFKEEMIKNPNFKPPSITENPKIGDYSLAIDIWEDPSGDDSASVIFQKNNKYAIVYAGGEKEFALSNALKTAKIIESRLD